MKAESLLKQVVAENVFVEIYKIKCYNFHAEPPEVRLIEDADFEKSSEQTTTEIFKDMLSQKKNLLLSKLTSFDSDVR